jgi:hypothetical protein
LDAVSSAVSRRHGHQYCRTRGYEYWTMQQHIGIACSEHVCYGWSHRRSLCCERSSTVDLVLTTAVAVVAMRTPDARVRPAVASSTGRWGARTIAGLECGGRVLVRTARPHTAGVSRAVVVSRDGGHPDRDAAARLRLLTVMHRERAEIARDGGSRISGTRNKASRPRTPRMVDAAAAAPHQVRTPRDEPRPWSLRARHIRIPTLPRFLVLPRQVAIASMMA